MCDDFVFRRPPEAPIYHPTEAEFQDPLGYINKIRPEAEKFGICKIKPPPNWAPSFAVDVDKFKFTPRVQKINELEALTRIKLNFLDQISKFWELQGTLLRIPVFGHKALDLYTLHTLVHRHDLRKNSDEKKWNQLAQRMGLQSNHRISIGAQLKMHYDKILYPYDVWKANQEGKKKTDASSPKKATTVKSRKASGRMGGSKKMERYDPLASYVCQVCTGGDDEEKMLLCDGCDDSYHTFCLNPPLDDVPKGEWRCPDCLEENLSGHQDGFGFEQATKEYTLQLFGEMADDFKASYFNMPVHLVSTETVEKEFWRVVSAIDEDVTVEYGADLHTMDHGSGFPTEPRQCPDLDETYINSGWNLNNLPVLEGSVFSHINADISGMKIPWMYVGMCFSTFCWHNEDHWSYSINYLHWGEPKTWYGVPGGRADDFEEAMKGAAPELFAQAPDLLHQLVTIMNPNILMNAGVPVYRMDQKAGEFIITFPRAYHAGFNQGYNFAEAVNFAPADWIRMGRECVQHYAKLNRFCVFSHDELVCAMASDPRKLDMSIAIATYDDVVKMFDQEKELRAQITAWGCHQSEWTNFENIQDDCRQCNICKTTLYLSAIVCSHHKTSTKKEQQRLVCLKHYNKYGCKECTAQGEKHVLWFRHSMDELQGMLSDLKAKTMNYERWVKSLEEVFKTPHSKITMEQLEEFLEEARQEDYPKGDLFAQAEKLLSQAELVCKFSKDLIGCPAVRTRKLDKAELRFKCTILELKMLLDQINSLRVIVPDKESCNNLYKKALQYRSQASLLLSDKNASIDDMSDCLQDATCLDIGFEEICKLRSKLELKKWLRIANSDDDKGSVWTMGYLQKIITDGNDIMRDDEAEVRMDQLCNLYETAFEWEQQAQKVLSTKNGEKFELKAVKEHLERAEKIPVAMPSIQGLRDTISKTASWLDKVSQFQPPNSSPFLDDLISLVESGTQLPVHLEPLNALRSQIDAAGFWREQCMRVFLKRASTIDLIEALVPRREIPIVPQRGKRKRLCLDGPSIAYTANLLGIPHPDVKNEDMISEAYARNIIEEVNSMKALRNANLKKLESTDSSEPPLFCVCQKPKDAFMIRCELCYEWFHTTCVPLPKIPNEESFVEAVDEGIDSQTVIAYKIARRETKYLAPCCARSRRPGYTVILELLMGLNKLPLNMIEGVALQLLTNRAMKWQNEWEKLLLNPEVCESIELLKKHITSVPVASPIKKDDTDSEENTIRPLMKIFFDSQLNTMTPGTLHSLGCNDSLITPTSTATDSFDMMPDKEMEIAMILTGMSQEKSVSTPVAPPPEPSTSSMQSASLENGNTEGDKAKLEPKITMSPEVIEEIENLLIEADLMEVSAEESDILWKLFDLAKPTVMETRDLMEVQRLIVMELESKGLSWEKRQATKKTKKRRLSGNNNKKPKSPRKTKPENMEIAMQETAQECDEDCAAAPCKQPTGKEVIWIQCDGCDLWFHLTCIGLKKSDVKKLDHYTCRNCAPKKQKISDVDDGSSCDTDSKLSSTGQLSVSSNKENTNNGASEDSSLGMTAVVKDEPADTYETDNYPTNSAVHVFSKVN